MFLKIWYKAHIPYFCTPKIRDDSVAQLVEQYTFNVWVLGPSPSGITKDQTNTVKIA